MSWWSKLAKVAGIGLAPFTGGASLIATGIGAAGEVLGGLAEGKAAGRSNAVQAGLTEEQINQARQAQYAQQFLAAEQHRQQSARDAVRNAAISDYVAGGGNPYVAKEGLKSYGFGPKAPGTNEQATARMLGEEAQRRVRGEGLLNVEDPGRYQIDPKLLKAGAFENIAGAIGGGLSAFGELTSASQQRTYLESLLRQNIQLNDAEVSLARKLGMLAGPVDISSGRSNV